MRPLPRKLDACTRFNMESNTRDNTNKVSIYLDMRGDPIVGKPGVATTRLLADNIDKNNVDGWLRYYRRVYS